MPTPNLDLKNNHGALDMLSAALVNAIANALDSLFASLLSKSVTGGVDVVLTDAEAENRVLELSGALSANINVVVPLWPGRVYAIYNGTSGAYTLTVKTPLGTGVPIGSGKRAMVYVDSANVVRLSADCP